MRVQRVVRRDRRLDHGREAHLGIEAPGLERRPPDLGERRRGGAARMGAMLFGQHEAGGVHVRARDMRMDVDAARHRDEPGRIDRLVGLRAGPAAATICIVADPQIADFVAAVGGIDDMRASDAGQHGLSVRFSEAGADALESLRDARRGAARRGGRRRPGSRVGRMHDRVMIDAGAPDRDAHVRLLGELGRSLAQGDDVHRARPGRRRRSEGGDPQYAIGFPRRDEPLGVETPGVMDRRAGAEAGPHRKAGHPAASREHACAIVRRGERQCRETRGFVQVAHEPMEHFDLERSETRRRPNRHAEARAFQGGGERVERGQGNLRSRDRTAFDPRAQRSEIARRALRRAPAATTSISPPKPRNCRVAPGRQPDDAPRDVRAFRPRRRRQQPLAETGPGFRQAVADQQHDVGAHARFARRRQHDSGFAQAVEIAQQSRRMHVLDDPADPFGERDRRPRSLDIRA